MLSFNPGTHMLGPVPFSAFYSLYPYINVVQSSRNHMFTELEFIVDFIFLVKKIFLTQL